MLAVMMSAGPALADPAVSATTRADTVHVPFIGVMTDVGLPDGGTASLVVRPVRALRLELGAAHNLISPGVRGGVTWIPLRSWATPVIGAAYGHFFERDANPIVRTVSGDPTFDSPILDRIGYDFAVARAGIELGRQRFTFFLHAGVTRVTGQLHDVAQASNAAAAQSGSMVTVTSTDPRFALWTVSADVGFVIYLY